MAFTMQLTDGTTTLSILETNDATVGYHLQSQSYTPSINRRNPSDFGAVYLPVMENFDLAIVGSSANDVHVKLAALVNLMDNVRLWFDSDAAAADAINFIYKPTGSTEAVNYRALVVGDASVSYSQYIERVGDWFRMPNVRVSFMRNEWLGAEESAVSTTRTQPLRLRSNFASSADLPSPVNVEIAITVLGGGNVTDSFTAIAPDDVLFYEAESLTLGADTGTTAIAKASGGSVAKMLPLNLTDPPSKGYRPFPYLTDPFPYRDFFVIGLFRNKAATINCRVDTVFSIGSLATIPANLTSGIFQKTQTQIPAGSVNPRIVNLGMFSFDELYTNTVDSWIEFRCYNDGVDATGASDLEFDCYAIVPVDADTTGFFSTTGDEKTKYGSDGRVLSYPSGKVYQSFASPAWPDVAAPYTGDGRLYTTAADVYAIHLFVYDATDGWRHHGVGNSTTHTMTATRRLASLSPL